MGISELCFSSGCYGHTTDLCPTNDCVQMEDHDGIARQGEFESRKEQTLGIVGGQSTVAPNVQPNHTCGDANINVDSDEKVDIGPWNLVVPKFRKKNPKKEKSNDVVKNGSRKSVLSNSFDGLQIEDVDDHDGVAETNSNGINGKKEQ